MGNINKAQADFLASQMLDSLGSQKEDFVPANTLSTLISLAGGLVDKARENLVQSNSVASGALSESFQIIEPQIEGNVYKVDIYMNYYGRFINSGVKGTKSGGGVYSFKYDMPSKKMLAAISEYLKRARISTATVKKYKGYGAHEIKNRRLTELDNAYAVARSIKQHGIKPTGFLDRAVAETQTIAKIELGKAFKIDVLNSLPKNLSAL